MFYKIFRLIKISNLLRFLNLSNLYPPPPRFHFESKHSLISPDFIKPKRENINPYNFGVWSRRQDQESRQAVHLPKGGDGFR